MLLALPFIKQQLSSRYFCVMISNIDGVWWIFNITFSFFCRLKRCVCCYLLQPSATENGAYDYTRSGNPTRTALEAWDFIAWYISDSFKQAFPLTDVDLAYKVFSCLKCRLLAKLEGADKAFCFNSGMAALATVTHLARAGWLCIMLSV